MVKLIEKIKGLLAIIIILAIALVAVIDTLPLLGSPITGFATGTVQLTIGCSTTITLPNSTINFQTMTAGQTNDTRDDIPYPFIVQNDGNTPLNITVSATNLFQNYTNPTNNYQVACGNFTYGGDWDGGIMEGYNCTDLSNRTYVAVPSVAAMIVYNLTWEDYKDKARLDFNVSIGANEIAGSKSSTVTVSGVTSVPCA